MSFKNKVVIVTGGSSGIGASTAIAYAKEGADVSIVGRNDEKLKKVATEIEKYGRKPLIIKADITKEEINSIIPKTVERFGKLDILINNAGVARTTSIFDSDLLESYDICMNTNLKSAFILSSQAVPHLIKSKGNIINISSVTASFVSHKPSFITYAVSKAALDHFTRCLAMELSSHGVKVNCVKPGPVKTDVIENMGYKGADAEKMIEVFKDNIFKRISEPEEIADVILFMTNDIAKGITGSTYVCDNGYLVNH